MILYVYLYLVFVFLKQSIFHHDGLTEPVQSLIIIEDAMKRSSSESVFLKESRWLV